MATQLLRTDTLPQDIRGGVHYDLYGPGTVTFVLDAPYKPFVSLVGDFNDWDTRRNVMVTDGHHRWWTTIVHPGETRYQYYVAIDNQTHVWVADPYAQQVRWEAQGPHGYIPSQPENYQWQDLEWHTPGLCELIIYELCVRDFGGAWIRNRPHLGRFEDVEQRLDHIAALGVTAIELMPIQSFPGNSSWGYNPVFYFAPSPTYGSPSDLKRLVDGCHARGMAVILDVAFNHAWGQHPYYQIYPPMYATDGELLADLNPYFHHTPDYVNSWGGVDWDHFVPETTRYFQDVVRYWLREYHIDGFRFDWVCGVDYDSSDPYAGGFNPFHGISAIAWSAREEKNDCILIGEYWSLYGTNPEKSAARLVQESEIDACWNGHFHHGIEEVLIQGWEWEKQNIFRTIGGFRDHGHASAVEAVNYTCSHDEVRPEHEIKYYAQQHIWRPHGMTVQELALRKALLGLVALFSAPGIPMLYAGQEYGEDAARTIDFVPMNWKLLERAEGRRHRDIVERLIRARLASNALQSDNIHFIPDDFAQQHVVRFVRWSSDQDHALVALNFGSQPITLSLDHQGRNRWREVVRDSFVSARGGHVSVELDAWQGALLVPA